MAVVAAALAPAPPAARADEPADRGVSFTAWAGGEVDRSVTTTLGLTALGNLEWFALGGGVEGRPGRPYGGHVAESALVGVQPELAGRRLLLLGEVGRRMFFEVAPYSWQPFLGVRIGVARTLPRHGPFELGLWGFTRYDLHGDTFSAGVAFEGGLRIESSHPWKDPPPEL